MKEMRTETGIAPQGNTGLTVLNILLGIWFFVSPWVFGAYTHPNAWNAWIVGALIVIVAAVRLRGFPVMSWINMALGIWVFVSPWVYGYTGNNGRLINSLCVGVLVFLAAIGGKVAATHAPRAQY